MGFSKNTQATRSTLMSVDSTLSEAITASQDYIPIASTTNFSTSVVAEIETTNEVVSFTDISANILTYSQDFDNSDWTKNATTITTDSTTAPDGTTTADKMISTSTSGGFVEESPTVTVGQPYTFSIFAKAGDTNWIRVTNQSTSTSGGWFNLTDGTLGAENGAGNVSSITSVGDGWYRCIRKFVSVVSGSQTVLYGNSSADGSSTAPGSNKFIYIWGAQAEEASSPTTYLPTTSAALVGLTGVTRGVNGTTAQSASSSDSIQQLPYALSEVNMPTRLKAISVASDGTGAGRFTLCDKVGTTLCDVDLPDTSLYEIDFGDDRGIIFPNGIYVANSDNLTAYTLFTDKHSGTGLS